MSLKVSKLSLNPSAGNTSVRLSIPWLLMQEVLYLFLSEYITSESFNLTSQSLPTQKSKKILSLMLIGVFLFLAGYDVGLFFKHETTFRMFLLFYTVLIFFDILVVLISLRYNLSYKILFRNSAFAIATILLRLSLAAPPHFKALLGVASVIFVLILTFFYSKYVRLNLKKVAK